MQRIINSPWSRPKFDKLGALPNFMINTHNFFSMLQKIIHNYGIEVRADEVNFGPIRWREGYNGLLGPIYDGERGNGLLCHGCVQIRVSKVLEVEMLATLNHCSVGFNQLQK